ncbi:MAG: DUF58 domain-containing protein [Treponema sp.]|nr:DUF58 domain-containing protein [Treponema sp.]
MKSGPGLVGAALAWFLLGAAAFFSDLISLIWLYTGLFLLLITIIEGLILFFFTDRLGARREHPLSLAQDEGVKVRVEVFRTDRGILPFGIWLYDLHPLSMETEAQQSFPFKLDRKLLLREGTLILSYTLIPRQRGLWFFQGLELMLSSPLRFWRLKVRLLLESSVRIYPNFNRIKASAGKDLRGLLERSGLKNVRRRGLGMEFNSLRDFQDGDSIRAVDWRATSRRRKVIIKEYQEEQDQQLLFLLDSGYRLHRLDAPRGRMQFDSALEAVLLLSWISLKHGDSVALGSFGADKRWFSPRKGLSAFSHLMNSFYDLNSTSFPSSPFSALEEALSRLRRRTFIILISNFREEDRESLSWILRQVEKRHLLLMVSLRERESEALAQRRPQNMTEALEGAAAFSYLASRRDLYRSWEHSGTLTLESSSEDLSAALINRYISVKRSGFL